MPSRKDPDADTEWRWLKTPATYCDTYSVDVFGGASIVRITFGEFLDRETEPYYRMAVALPISDAKALAKSLERLIKRAEEKKKDGDEPSEG
ncbi:MAG TPA: hypothetical protein VMU22_02730 [Rhizomicrobium sp.]|nr:hypothetical protein [Rhizomicrobium sp.]